MALIVSRVQVALCGWVGVVDIYQEGADLILFLGGHPIKIIIIIIATLITCQPDRVTGPPKHSLPGS